MKIAYYILLLIIPELSLLITCYSKLLSVGMIGIITHGSFTHYLFTMAAWTVRSIIICVMADRLAYYFWINDSRSFPRILHSIAQQIKSHLRLFNYQWTNQEGLFFIFQVIRIICQPKYILYRGKRALLNSQ